MEETDLFLNPACEDDETFIQPRSDARPWRDRAFAVLFLLFQVGMITSWTIIFKEGDPASFVPESASTMEVAAQSFLQRGTTRLHEELPAVAEAIVLALFLGALWVLSLKVFTKVFVYFTIVMGLSLGSAASVVLFVLGQRRDDVLFTCASVAVAFVVAVVAIMVFLARSKIKLSISLIKEASRAVHHNPSVVPVGLVLLGVLCSYMFLTVKALAYSSTMPEGSGVGLATPNVLFYFNVFGLLWFVAMVSAIFHTIIAGGVTSWYFARDGRAKRASSPTMAAVGRALTTSFGSLAFGSLILAAVGFASFVVSRLHKASKKSRAARYVLACVQCVLLAAYKIVSRINRFAYIYIAMHGDSFCDASKRVSALMERSSVTVVVMDLVGDVVLIAGKLFGTSVCLVTMVAILEVRGHTINVSIVAFITVAAYIIFSVYAKLIAASTDAIFVAYLEDMESNGDNVYMPLTLHTTLKELSKDVPSEDSF